MNKRQLTVKVSTLQEAISEFKNIWRRHEKGEKINTPVETMRFENTLMLMKTLTPKRLELLQKLHSVGKMSIRALAKKLLREYSNVHQDIKILYGAGLVMLDIAGKYYIPWDSILTEFSLHIKNKEYSRNYHYCKSNQQFLNR